MQLLQHFRWMIILSLVVGVTSCSQPSEPVESDLRFADLVRVMVSAQDGNVACLFYVQTYSGCQEARIAAVSKTDSTAEVQLTTFQTTKQDCDSLEHVSKILYTFNAMKSGNVQVRIRSERDTRTNNPLDTLVSVHLP